MIFPLTRLNEIFDENFPIEGIFSVYGDYGVGKTTFSLQILLNTIKLGNPVIFIYTKKNIPIKKLSNFIEDDATCDLEKILNKLLIIQISKFEELRKLTLNLDFLILEIQKKNDKIPPLIIIDSITDLYRITLNRDKKEINIRLNFQLNQILATLRYLNQMYGIEILIVNDITSINQDDQNFEIQSGGLVMNYWISNSLKILRTEIFNQRRLELTKNKETYDTNITSDLTKRGFE